jgi:hypothetical protein
MTPLIFFAIDFAFISFISRLRCHDATYFSFAFIDFTP